MGPKWPKRAKKGKKSVFFKYSCSIYRWKAYYEEVTTSVKQDGIFNFFAKMDTKKVIRGQKLFLFKYGRIIYPWKAYSKKIRTFVKKI